MGMGEGPGTAGRSPHLALENYGAMAFLLREPLQNRKAAVRVTGSYRRTSRSVAGSAKESGSSSAGPGKALSA